MLSIARCLVSPGHHVSVFSAVAEDLKSLWMPGFKTFPEEEFVVDGLQIRRFPICYRKWRRGATLVSGSMPHLALEGPF
jgi:hypothetical protein